MPGKKIGLDSELLIKATTPADTVVGGLLSLDGPNFSQAKVDVTEIKTGGTAQFNEYIGGYIDGGDVTVELAFYSTDDSGQELLKTGLAASTCYAFRLYRGSTVDDAYDFKAVITELGSAIPGKDEMLTRSVTLSLSGVPDSSIG